ncbi:MAG: hypothetical protein ACTHU0_01285 [Kofleriaceae bacterium]
MSNRLPTAPHLRVVPNPFAAPLDQHGRPCGFVRHDPDHPAAQEYIGARMVREVIGNRRPPNHPQATRLDSRLHYDLTPRPIVDTSYHRKRVRDGDLLPADDATARRCGVKFEPPAKRLASLEEAAIAEYAGRCGGALPPVETWQANHGFEPFTTQSSSLPATPSAATEASK